MRKRAYLFIVILFIIQTPLLHSEDPAKGHYDSALYFLKNQQISQALEDLNVILKSFPGSPYADDALMQLGILAWKDGRIDEALGFFKQIKDSYAASDSAPAAYYHLGEIYLSRQDAESLEEALANFQRVTRVYPDSEWVDESLVGAGTVFRRKNEFDRAWNEFAKVKVRYAESAVAARAQYEMAVSSLDAGYHFEAAREFQQVVQRYPESEYATAALQINTILYRLYMAPHTGTVYRLHSSFGSMLAELDDPTGLAADSKGNLYLADKGRRTVTTLDANGRITGTASALSPHFISVNDQDRVLVANDETVTWLGKESVSFPNPQPRAEPLQQIRSAAVNDSGKYFLVSNKFPGILVYEKTKTITAEFPFSRSEKDYYKVLTNPLNQILAADKDRKHISVYAPDGKFLFAIGPSGKGYTIERIEDVAIDRANHIYVLEKNPRSILIFSPSGELLKYITSQKKGALDFDDAKLITVGPDGAIFLVDKDKRRILKLG